MERPWYQRTTAYAGYLVVGFVSVGGLLSAFANARALVTPIVTLLGSAIIVLGLATIEFFLRRRRRTWILEGGQHIFPTGLGVKGYMVAVGILLLLWMPRSLEWWSGSTAEPRVGAYECLTGDWKLQACRVEMDGAGKRVLLFNGPTHDSVTLVDTYSGAFQTITAGTSIAVRNEFSPDPGNQEPAIQTSLIMLRTGGGKAWNGVWQVADGSSHPFSMRVSP
jgi:hypothetical protein